MKNVIGLQAENTAVEGEDCEWLDAGLKLLFCG